MTDDAADRGFAARTLLGEDVIWIADAMLSASKGDVAAGVSPLVLTSFLSRIVYEGRDVVTSDDPHVGVPRLAELLTDDSSDAIARARHAVKLLDDTHKTFDTFREDMRTYWVGQRTMLRESVPLWAHSLAPDLGVFSLHGHVIGATVPLQVRFDIPGRLDGAGGETFTEFGVTLGSQLTVYSPFAGGPKALRSTLDLRPLEGITQHDYMVEDFLDDRYDPDIDTEAKLLLLLVEQDVNTAAHVLPLTRSGHEFAEFRARLVSTWHALTSLSEILDAYPNAKASSTVRVRAFLRSPAVRGFLDDRKISAVRNRFVHYVIRSNVPLALDRSDVTGSIITSLHPTHTADSLNQITDDLVAELSALFGQWRYGYVSLSTGL